LVRKRCRTMKEVESFAIGEVLIVIENLDFRNDPRALHAESGIRTDATSAANNGNFHARI
jgi:hypothetical protein